MNTPRYDLSTLVGRQLSATQTRKALEAVRNYIASLHREDLAGDAGSIDSAIREIAAQQQVSPEDLFCALRIALCGNLASPGLYDIMSALGGAETVSRLDDALRALGDRA